MDDLAKDKRFSHVDADPKFRGTKKQDRKIKVDKRFEKLFTEKASKQKCTIDKRGRPINKTTKDNYHQFYDFSDSDEDEDVGKSENDKIEEDKEESEGSSSSEMSNNNVELDSDNESQESEEDDSCGESTEEVEESEKDNFDYLSKDESESSEEDDGSSKSSGKVKQSQKKLDKQRNLTKQDQKGKYSGCKNVGELPDFSRGFGNLSSSEDEDEDEEEDDVCDKNGDRKKNGIDAVMNPWVELVEKEVPIVEESSRRLAICNMNWDFVSAQDLFLLCNSFKPKDGVINSVTVYPTDFGLERMKEEDLNGPKDIIQSNGKKKQKNDKKCDSEVLRLYELNRHRYYVAVVDCDSVETADVIYSNCDGLEFEKTGTKLDFRYIPDDVTFEYEPKSVASSLPAKGTYKPQKFVDAAISKTDVKLSWDKTSNKRLALTQMDLKKCKDLEALDEDMQEYVAPYSSGDEEDEDLYADYDFSLIPGGDQSVRDGGKKSAEELKAQLFSIDRDDGDKSGASDDDVHMEITWDIGLQEAQKETEKQKGKDLANAKLTPSEQYEKKRKEMKRQKEREKRREKKTKVKSDKNNKRNDELEEDDELQLLVESSSNNMEDKAKTKKQKKESMKKRSKKRKQEAEEQALHISEAVASDPRFSEMTDKDFAVDPEFQKKKRRKFEHIFSDQANLLKN